MKTVLVTGASQGIGLGVVRHYSALGWRVIACCRRPQDAGELASSKPALLLELDVTKTADIERVVEAVKHESIDLLMNNAGIRGPSVEEFDWREPGPWLETLQVNALAPYRLARALVDQVEKSECKLIVNISSYSGSIGLNRDRGDYFVYRSSKAALNAATRCLAHQVRDRGIIALVIHPGSVRTEMNLTGKISVGESVKGIQETLGRVRMEDSGSFLDYLGNPLPW